MVDQVLTSAEMATILNSSNIGRSWKRLHSYLCLLRARKDLFTNTFYEMYVSDILSALFGFQGNRCVYVCMCVCMCVCVYVCVMCVCDVCDV